MRSVVLLLLGGCVAAFVSNACGVELQPAPGGTRSQLGWRVVDIAEEPLEILSREPSYGSKRPFYLGIRLGNASDTVVTAVLDESVSDGGYDTLIVDANNNNDLTDDSPASLKVVHEGRSMSFDIDPVDVLVKYGGGGERTLRLKIELYGYKAAANRIWWSAGSQVEQHLEGRIDIGKRKDLLVGVYDTCLDEVASNGCFDDYCYDRLRLDLDNDGQLDPETEDFPLSRIISVDGSLWNLTIDSAGRALEVRPSDVPTGTATFNLRFRKGARFSGGVMDIAGPSRGYAFAWPVSSREKLILPEGSYRIARATALMADDAGTEWEAAFSVPQFFTVRRKRNVDVALSTFGAPFKIEPRVRGRLKLGRTVCIMPDLIGVGGEEYQSVSPVGTRMAPILEIMDAEGIILLSATMEYG